MNKKTWVKVIALFLVQGIFIGNAAAGEIGQTLVIRGGADFLAPQLMIDNIQIQQACAGRPIVKHVEKTGKPSTKKLSFSGKLIAWITGRHKADKKYIDYAKEFARNLTVLEDYQMENRVIPAIQWMATNALEMNAQDREKAVAALLRHRLSESDEVQKEANKALNALNPVYKNVSGYYTVIKPVFLHIERIKDVEEYREQAVQSLAYLLRHDSKYVRKETHRLLEELEVDTGEMFAIYTELLGVGVVVPNALKEAIVFLRDNAGRVSEYEKWLAYDALLSRQRNFVSYNPAMGMLVDEALERLRPSANPLRNAPFTQAETAIEQAI